MQKDVRTLLINPEEQKKKKKKNETPATEKNTIPINPENDYLTEDEDCSCTEASTAGDEMARYQYFKQKKES